MQLKTNPKGLKHQITLSLGIFALLALLSSCASLTGYQDGKTLGTNNFELTTSANFSQSPTFLDLIDSVSADEIPTFGFPNIEIGGRYGVIEKLDLTLKMNTNLNIALGAKYQFLGDKHSKFALSSGVELGTFGLVTNLWNIQIPLYASFHPTEKFAIYASPRYIYQFTSLAGLIDWNYYGGNIGLMFGSKHKFAIDAGFYKVGVAGVRKIALNSFGIGGKFYFGNDDDDQNQNRFKKTKKKRK
jgi:hypothetical protein